VLHTSFKIMSDTFNILAAAAGGNPVTQITTEFGVTWGLFTSQLIAFAIVAYMMNKFAYKPVLEVLELRKTKIAEGLENADKIKAELGEAETTRKEIIEKANTQANALIEEAREAAQKVRDTETQKAVASAEEIISKARQASEAEHVKMLAELRKEVGRLVVDTTSKVAGKVLTGDDQKRLIDETNDQLAA
jgi:F-type H+-transporting ATPase subunit b